MSKINISELLSHLNNDDIAVRTKAVKTITSVENRNILKDLVSSIADADEEISSKAVKILCKNSIAEAVEYLEDIFDKGCNDNTIKKIVEILAHIRTNRSFSLIKRIIKNVSDHMTDECISIISGHEVNVLSLFSKTEMFDDFNRVTDIVIRSTDYLEKIADFFAHPDKNVRIYCLKQLQKTRHSKTLSYILPCLNDSEWEVRKTAVDIVGSFNNEKLIDILIKSLHDPHIKVREATKEALISIARVFPSQFIPFVTGNIKSLQRISIKILGNSGAPHIISHLISPLNQSDENIQQLICETIEKLVDSYVENLSDIEEKGETIPHNIIVKQETLITEPIASLLSSPHDHIREFSIAQLFKFNVAGFKLILKHMKHSGIIPTVISAFNSRGASAKKALVQDVFDTHDEQIVLQMIEFLKKINSKEFIPVLIENLSENSETIKNEIIEILRKLGYENQYIGILSEDDPQMRANAVKILSNFRSPRIAELLASHLNDPEKEIRLDIITYLSKLGSVNHMKYFVEALEDPDSDIQIAALEGLNKLDTPESYAVIKSKIKTKDLKVKRKITQIIGEKTQKTYLNTFDNLTEAQKVQTGKTLKKINPNLIKTLDKDLENKNSQIRIKAVRILATIIDRDDPVITPLLLKVIDDPEKKVRATIATALTKDGSERAFQALIKLLNDPNERVRANVIEGLEFCGKPREIVGMILPFLKDENNRIRANTVIALYNLGYTKVFNTLVEMLRSTNRMMRISAVYALGELKIEKSIPTLKSLLNDEDDDVRFNAIRALTKIRTADIVILIKRFIHDDNQRISTFVRDFLKQEFANE